MPEDAVKKYKLSKENQMVMLPISFQDQLVPETLEHTINRLVDPSVGSRLASLLPSLF